MGWLKDLGNVASGGLKLGLGLGVGALGVGVGLGVVDSLFGQSSQGSDRYMQQQQQQCSAGRGGYNGQGRYVRGLQAQNQQLALQNQQLRLALFSQTMANYRLAMMG